MAWTPNAPYGVTEVAKTRWRAVPFTSGRGLDLGCGAQRLFDTEFVIGLDNGAASQLGQVVQANMQMDVKELVAFAPNSWDYVFSSFLLQEFPHDAAHIVLRDWMRVVRPGGHLVLYLPDEELAPKVSEPDRGIEADPNAHPMQRWNVNYDRVVEAMKKTHWSWDLVYFEKCSADDEYGLFFAFRKLK